MISSNKQKIICFIPGINILMPFIWLYNYRQSDRNSSLLKSVMKVACVFFSLVVFFEVMSGIFAGSSAGAMIDIIGNYLIPFAVGQVLISHQKSLWGSNF